MKKKSSYNDSLYYELSLINCGRVMPVLQQAIEVEQIKQQLNPSEDGEDLVRELRVMLTFFRCRHLRTL